MIRKVQQRAQQTISGFKSPADDYLEGRLDISDVLVIDPHCTFYFRMDGDTMSGFQIPHGSLLVVDRSLRAIDGAIVIACWQGKLLCRSLNFSPCGAASLQSSNGIDPIAKDANLEVWGVVIAVCYNVMPKGLLKGKYRNVCAL
ncbi:S24 family peptidase [Sphingobacterium chungjuense]|uniref:S24 family peptidase n=1 Tax=Sphingobacterium chungjuense TaxID=2675553 RepID=UPI001409B5E6|nr:S24 family peptidase [Sphingobacterium chungjuense]